MTTDQPILRFNIRLATRWMLGAALCWYATTALADEIDPMAWTQTAPATVAAPRAVTPVPAAATPPSRFQALRSRASELAMQALGMIGIHYKYGGNTPENGLDCSGLVRYVFRQAWGAELPRTSEEISRIGQRVDTAELQPGDLVFYNTLKRTFSHVGIYLGDNKFIHSPSTGGQVRIEDMGTAYWKNRFNGARRITDPESK